MRFQLSCRLHVDQRPGFRVDFGTMRRVAEEPEMLLDDPRHGIDGFQPHVGIGGTAQHLSVQRGGQLLVVYDR